MAKLWARTDQLDNPHHPLAQQSLEMASFILYKLTAEKYPGFITVKEVFDKDYFSTRSNIYRPQVVNGKMMNLPQTSARGSGRELYLRNKPVKEIKSVSINGRVLDPSEYELRNFSFIIRTNKQDWILSSSTSIEVEYVFGAEPPAAGVEATLKLATELILALEGSPECSIPKNVTGISRQGVEFAISDPQMFLEQGRTGLEEVDMFIMAANPLKSRKRSKFYNPYRAKGETRQ